MHQIGAGHRLEQLAGNMRRAAAPGRRHINFAWIGLGISDELGKRLRRNRRIHHHDIWKADDRCDRRDVAEEIEIELVVKRRVDCARRAEEAQGIAVGSRAHDCFGADIAAGAGTIFNDELLTQPLRQPLPDQPRSNVGRTSGSERNDQAHRPCRIGLCQYDPRHNRQRGGSCGQMQECAAGKFHGVPRWSLGIIYHAVACTTRAEPSHARVEIMSLSDELLSLSSVEMRRRIGTKEISPVELVEASIARIEALNPAVNAIAATDFAHARKLAISAESAARKGEQLGPLHGLPTGIKDLHETAGLLTTYGSPLYRSHVPAHDAAMVALVRKAGAIILCKTNVPEFGAGANTRNLVWGAT